MGRSVGYVCYSSGSTDLVEQMWHTHLAGIHLYDPDVGCHTHEEGCWRASGRNLVQCGPRPLLKAPWWANLSCHHWKRQSVRVMRLILCSPTPNITTGGGCRVVPVVHHCWPNCCPGSSSGATRGFLVGWTVKHTSGGMYWALWQASGSCAEMLERLALHRFAKTAHGYDCSLRRSRH